MALRKQPSVGRAAAPTIFYDFTPDLLAAFPLDALSQALRSSSAAIVAGWTQEIGAVLPAASQLPFDQLADHVPNILAALADALASQDAAGRRALLERSPSQGITRFQQHYDTRDLMAEDRVLRRIVVQQTDEALVKASGRPMTLTEHLAINMGLDLMSQQAVVAFVEHQGNQLRAAAEAELRYLSFLSHDLSNNLSTVTLWLQVLKGQLQPHADMTEQVDSLDTIQQAILSTLGGMGRLLQAERLRHGGRPVEPREVDVLSLVTNQTRQIAEAARRRGVEILVEVPKEALVVSDPDLIALVLQNLIGNAAKFAAPGHVYVRATRQVVAGKRVQWAIAVIDEGPGIPSDQVERIFIAFQRGTMQGEAGVGLGLAIASRAAALLGGTLTVDSAPGRGSTFTLALPPG